MEQTLVLESALLRALSGDQQFLMEAVKRARPYRAGMSKMKKILIGGALAATLAGGVAKKLTGGADAGDPAGNQARTQQVDQDTETPRSMGRGRVTQERDL